MKSINWGDKLQAKLSRWEQGLVPSLARLLSWSPHLSTRHDLRKLQMRLNNNTLYIYNYIYICIHTYSISYAYNMYIYIHMCGGHLWGIFRLFRENSHMYNLHFGLFTCMCTTAPWECINHCRCTREGKIHCK